MSKADYTFKKPNGQVISCYGNVAWDSNFFVCCVNEFDDGFADIDTEKYNTWKKICDYLLKDEEGEIVQIESC